MKSKAKMLIILFAVPLVFLVLFINSISKTIINDADKKYKLIGQDILEIELYQLRDFKKNINMSNSIILTEDEKKEFIDFIKSYGTDSSFQRQTRYVYLNLKITTKERTYYVVLSKGELNLFIDIECEKYREYIVLKPEALYFIDKLYNRIML